MSVLEERAPAVAVLGASKRFAGVTALDGLDLACRSGEVHVLLGENGAGKSTLVALLAGLQRPEAGQIFVEGRPVSLRSPRQALDHGIGVLPQHPVLVPSLSVLDNLALGQGRLWRPIPRRNLANLIRQVAAEADLACDSQARVGDLSLGEQRDVGLLQALLRGTRLLVLDEVTAALSPDRATAMGGLMRRVAARGIAVLWITHRIDEAVTFGDRITVLRQGRNAGAVSPDRLAADTRAETREAILGLMFGAAALPPAMSRPPAPLPPEQGPVLDVRDLTVWDARRPVRDVSFTLSPGEILGIAGLDGNGQAVLAEALAGQRPSAAGTVLLDGVPLDDLGVRARHARGLGYGTDDRLGEAVVGALPVAVNLLLKDIGAAPFWCAGVARQNAIAARARALMTDFDIRAPGGATPAGHLSGGNIQKVVLARELSRHTRVAILARPTHGLDARSTRAVRDRIQAAAASGAAVLLISSDLGEIFELSHRVSVMTDGRLSAVLPNRTGIAQAVSRLMGRATA